MTGITQEPMSYCECNLWESEVRRTTISNEKVHALRNNKMQNFKIKKKSNFFNFSVCKNKQKIYLKQKYAIKNYFIFYFL